MQAGWCGNGLQGDGSERAGGTHGAQTWHTGRHVREQTAATRSGKRVCMGSCECVQLCKYSWVTHTTTRLSARLFAAAGVAGAAVWHAGFVLRLPCISSTLHRQAQRQACAGGCPACLLACLLSHFTKRSARQAAKPRAPSWSCAFFPCHPTCFPATSGTHIISSQPGPALPPGCSQGSSHHSWAESDSYAQLEEAQMRTWPEQVRCEQHRPSVRGRERGKCGWEGSGRHRHTRTHTGQHCCRERKLLICWE